MKRVSIKLRVTAWFTLIMLIAASLIFFIMTSHRTAQIKAEAQKNLVESVTNFSGTMNRPRPNPPEPPENPPNPFPDGIKQLPDGQPRMYGGGIHIAVYNENQELIQGQIPFELGTLSLENDSLRTVSSGGENYLVYDKLVKTENQTLWIKGVSNLSNSLNAANATVLTDFLLILLLIIAASFGAYLIVRQALKPVEQVSHTARTIADSSDLSRRINLGEGKDEIYSLAAVLDEMLNRLQRAFETEQQFTSDASHELRTPVAVILSECEYALDCAKTEEELTESVTVIKRQTDKMSRLITDLLTLSRMDKMSCVQMEQTDISELLEVVCEEQREIQNKTLICEIEKRISCKAEPSLLARLFVNLITNAFTYGNTTVKVSLTTDRAQAVLQVQDDGPGIPKEELSKIWERFYQVDQSRSHPSGSMGLGLSMVKQIAQIHGGTVSVESQPGKGSIFSYRMKADTK